MRKEEWARHHCERKDAYRKSVAERIAKKMNTTTAFGQNVRAYLCKVCTKYHVGNPTRKGQS